MLEEGKCPCWRVRMGYVVPLLGTPKDRASCTCPFPLALETGQTMLFCVNCEPVYLCGKIAVDIGPTLHYL